MPRKHPNRAGADPNHSVLMEFNAPVGPPGPAWPLRFPGFRNLYLPSGSLCLIERRTRGGRPIRVLVLERSMSPFYPPREFWKMQQTFLETKRAGRGLRWIAFYPGRKRPRYVFRPIFRHEVIQHHLSFIRKRASELGPGRPRKVDYEELRQYHRKYPTLSQTRIAQLFKVSRPVVARALRSKALSK